MIVYRNIHWSPQTKTGIIGVKVAIMPPNARLYDKIVIDEEIKRKISLFNLTDNIPVKKEILKEKKNKKNNKDKESNKTENGNN